MARMNKQEYAKYKKKWEKFKKDVFINLEDGNVEKTMELIDGVKDLPEFFQVPEIPEEIDENVSSPINETLSLLAHKRIFLTKKITTEEAIEQLKSRTDITTLSTEQQKFIQKLEENIEDERLKQAINNLDEIEEDNAPKQYINLLNEELLDIIPHFPEERMHAIPVIEHLISLGADPHSWINKRGQFYKNLLALDIKQLSEYVIDKIPDTEFTQTDRSGANILAFLLEKRAEKSFNIAVREKEHLIDFNKVFGLASEQNLLHFAMGNYMPEATAFLINKNVSLTQRSVQGNYPADIIPNKEIAEAREETKNVIREDNPLLKSHLLEPFIHNFKPHKALCDVDEFYKEMAGLTKLQLVKERDLIKTQVKKFRTEF